MQLRIVERTGPVWSGECTEVIIPAANGFMGILPGHTPVMALLKDGEVRVNHGEGRVDSFQIEGGFITVDSDQLDIVVEKAVSTPTK